MRLMRNKQHLIHVETPVHVCCCLPSHSLPSVVHGVELYPWLTSHERGRFLEKRADAFECLGERRRGGLELESL
jgi:hypothetical protein